MEGQQTKLQLPVADRARNLCRSQAQMEFIHLPLWKVSEWSTTFNCYILKASHLVAVIQANDELLEEPAGLQVKSTALRLNFLTAELAHSHRNYTKACAWQLQLC